MASKLAIIKVMFIAILAMTLLNIPKVQAHVLVADTSNTTGAVLHITPDDDPIAGESSHIFFDIQNKNLSDGTYVPALTITNSGKDEQSVEVVKDGSYVSGKYIFPTRGVYTIKLTIKHSGKAQTFSVTQRVSRGISAPNDYGSKVRYQWAEILIVASLTGGGVGLIIFISRLRTILKHSQ